MTEEQKKTMRERLEQLMAQCDEVKIVAGPFDEIKGPKEIKKHWPVAAKHYMLECDRKALRRRVRSVIAYIMHLYMCKDVDYFLAEPLMKMCAELDEELSLPLRRRLNFETDLKELYEMIQASEFNPKIFENVE